MDKTHVCLSEIKIPKSTDINTKRKRYLKQVKNPYKVNCEGLTVSLSFGGTDKLENKLINYLSKI